MEETEISGYGRLSMVTMDDEEPSKLPKHVQEIMYGADRQLHHVRDSHQAIGLLNVSDLNVALNLQPQPLPWCLEPLKKAPLTQAEKKIRGNVIRRKMQAAEEEIVPLANKYSKYDLMIARNPYHKIAFINSQQSRDVLPKWCQERLRMACRSARFELPFDRAVLETIKPLQFLARYTRLYREQRRRYSRIFQKHKSKINDYIEYQSMFPALNSMFGMFLGELNFSILCTALFIDAQTVLDETTFIGVCTFADRLFWTAYLEYIDRNTFTFLGPNRSVLEYVDFESLKRKLDGVKLSKEMHHLLYSLA